MSTNAQSVKPKPIFIAMPVYGPVPAPAFGCIRRLLMKKPFPFHMVTREGDSAICRARNFLVQEFLESKCEKLLFIDSDIIFNADQIARIASHEEDLVGGFYALKDTAPDTRWCFNALAGASGQLVPDERGLAQVAYVGTGFMCIHRRVFERMIADGRAERYRSDYAQRRIEHEFFKMRVHRAPATSSDPGEGRYLSEDWLFCQDWMEMGGKVWLDCNVILAHVGQAAFPLPGQNTGLTPVGSVTVNDGEAGGDTVPGEISINRIAPEKLAAP